jgi:hypothetical protein
MLSTAAPSLPDAVLALTSWLWSTTDFARSLPTRTQYEAGFFYNETDYSLVPDDYFDSNFHFEQGRILRDPTGAELGDYYGRSLAHFIAGGHTDEAGNFHKGYNYNITIFQSINEPEAEHKCNYSQYTHRCTQNTHARRRTHVQDT